VVGQVRPCVDHGIEIKVPRRSGANCTGFCTAWILERRRMT